MPTEPQPVLDPSAGYKKLMTLREIADFTALLNEETTAIRKQIGDTVGNVYGVTPPSMIDRKADEDSDGMMACITAGMNGLADQIEWLKSAVSILARL